MITTGVSGRSWRAAITPWGAIVPWPSTVPSRSGTGADGDARPLEWYVAAEDRWHVPSVEPATRQRRIDGTAVVETRVRVPTGDVVQTIASVADGGGLTVIEIENDSTMAVAVAFGRGGLRTERRAADVPIEGLSGAGVELHDDAFVIPVAHRSTVRVAIAHDGSGDGPLPAVPPAAQVARGWSTVTDRASRFVLPAGEFGETLALDVTAQRCEVALGEMAHAADDAAAFAIGLGELVRMGERPDPWLVELVEAVERLGPSTGWIADAALDAASRVLAVAGERRALADLSRIIARRGERATRPAAPVTGVGAVPWLEQRLADRGALLPDGVPTAWLGSSIEVYGVPIGPSTTVSYAVRWHGERPAVLWEVTGDDDVVLTAPSIDPSWTTTERSGEALWAAPVPAGTSFS